MIGAYVDRCASRIASLEPSGPRVASASVDEASGLLATLLERLGVPVVEEGAALSLSVSTDGRALTTSLPEERVHTALAGALSASPAAPTGQETHNGHNGNSARKGRPRHWQATQPKNHHRYHGAQRGARTHPQHVGAGQGVAHKPLQQ